MKNRGKKRAEIFVELPADKRFCSSSEFKPSLSTSSAQTPMTSTNSNHDIETSSDSEDERDSGHGSCHSDDNIGDVDQRQNTEALYNLQRQQSVGERAKLMKIVSGLSGDAGESEQLVALSELCELLSFCTDDSFSNAIANPLSAILVKLARHESNQDIMLLAIRALTYLCDAHPQSSGFVVSHGGVSALCERLMAIDYVDVAEQCFQALEKISREQPLACLESGAIMAVLTYVDFFSTSVQRVALSTVLNICEELPSESPSPFMEAVPTLCNLLRYEDNQLVETAASCLEKIAERIRHSPNLLDELAKHGLIRQATHLIDLNSRTTLCQPVYTGLIGILAKLASGSLTAMKTLFELNISSILKDILSTYGLSLGTPSSHRVDGQCNQALEVLKLLNELLPVIGVNQGVQLEKEVFLVNQPNLLQKFGMDLLPVLIQVVSSGDLYICYCCLSVINKLVYFGESNMLLELLTSTNISSFLAGIFTRKDHHVLTLALQIVDNILKKLKDVYLGAFVKEGVFFAIDSLLAPEKGSQFMFSSQKSAARDARRCLCYLFDASPSPSTSESENCRLENDSVQNLAKHIKTNYFETDSLNFENGVTGILHKLKESSTDFYLVYTSMDDHSRIQNEEVLFSLLHQIMLQLNGSGPISTFEFVESGVVKLLADYLSNGQFSREKNNIYGSVSQPYVTEKRLEFFGKLFLTPSDPHLDKFPLSELISKLQNALSSVENFPVVLNPAFMQRNSYVMVPHKHVISYPSLKIQFVRGEGETDLSDYFEELVTVDPFSSFDSIEEFLWPEVGKKRSEQEETSTDALDGLHLLFDSSPQNPDLKEVVDGVSPITNAMQEQQNSTQEDSSMSSECPESCSCEDASRKLMFYLEEEQLDATLHLYQAILQLKSKAGNDTVTAAPLWSQLIRVTYKKASKGNESISQPSIHQATCSSDWAFTQYTPLFSSMSESKLAAAVEKFSSTYDILFLLRILEGMNRYRFHLMSRERICAFAEGRIEDLDNLKVESSDVLGNEFVSRRLTEKLEQQMRDPLAISPRGMPSWCVQLMDLCPFLFGFEGRCKYFRLAAFSKWQSQPSSSSNSHSGENNSPRKKFLVYRHQILESAAKIMDLHAGQKAVLEVEYDEEVGTGLGPSLEFFTLVSNEFQNSGMGMWREDNTALPSIDSFETVGNKIVGTPFGFFPWPWSSTMNNSAGVEFSDVVKKFVLLGQVVAKALQDGRVLDIFFSKAFYKLILGQDLSLYDIQSFDPELGRVLIEFQALVLRRKHLESSEGKSMLQNEPSFRNTTIEDLCLDFTLPGYPDYVLISGTSIDMVNMMNLEEYVAQVVDATVNLGISRQMEAFRSGFNQVFPISHLQIFNEEELERLLCGEREIWNSSALSDHMKFDHGYTASSPPIINLLEIMQEFNHEQQKAFLQFVTGAPRLPPGGLASLNPKLTVVRKHCGQRVDEDLPSVMTCANYLKLPPYSSKETMKEKLLYAITEGQGSFHLS